MFNIYGGAAEFKQWELDKFVTNSCMKEGDEVVFRNSHGETYVVKAFAQGGEILADVPNYLLRTADNILVDLEQGNDRHPECRTTFTVVAQDKPDGYECKYNVPERQTASSSGSGLDLAELEKNPLSGKYVEGMGYDNIVALLEETAANEYTHPMFGKAWMIENAPKLTPYEDYTVVYNGVEYNCVCAYAPTGFSQDEEAVAMGNFSVAGGENTGEPFAMLISHALQKIEIIDLNGSTSVKVKIKKNIPVTIDRDLLPVGTENERGTLSYEDIFSNLRKVLELVVGTTTWREVNLFGRLVRAKYSLYVGFPSGMVGQLLYGWAWNPAEPNALYCNLLYQGDKCRVVAEFDGKEDNSLLTKVTLYPVVDGDGSRLVLKSTTDGSNKIFAITVDDGGTISAKETTCSVWD